MAIVVIIFTFAAEYVCGAYTVGNNLTSYHLKNIRIFYSELFKWRKFEAIVMKREKDFLFSKREPISSVNLIR